LTPGGGWTNFPAALSTGKPLLLSADTLIRFLPSKSFSGVVNLTVKAWDGGTGFSTSTLTATCLVNTAPTLTP
jgi:hypothetical protein